MLTARSSEIDKVLGLDSIFELLILMRIQPFHRQPADLMFSPL